MKIALTRLDTLDRRRRRWLIGAALGVCVTLPTGITVTALSLTQQAQLSQDEVSQIRTEIDYRVQIRNGERAEVKEQLDAQRRALCGMLTAFEKGASPNLSARLRVAKASVECGPTVSLGP